jgi:uncharacterized protein
MSPMLAAPRLSSMPSTDPLWEYAGFFMIGLSVGFGHCIGMCGPIIVAISLNLQERSLMGPHLLYHIGRLATYGVLGAIMGVTGSFTSLMGRMAGIQQSLLFLTGLGIMVMGASMAGWIPAIKKSGEEKGRVQLCRNSIQKFLKTHSPYRFLLLGAALGLLPCGPVYTALLSASRFGMESPTQWRGCLMGTGLMLAFGFGTVPAMLIVARLSKTIDSIKRKIIYQFGAIITIFLGAVLAYRGIRYY